MRLFAWWPWMTKARHNLMIDGHAAEWGQKLGAAVNDKDLMKLREAVARERADRAEAALVALQERHDAFVGSLAERVLTPPPVPEPPVRAPREEMPGEIVTAIDWVAQGDMVKRRYLQRFAKSALRRTNADPKAIADEILNGARTADDEDGMPA